MEPIGIGIVSDEIAADFETALRYGKQWGIDLFELRCIGAGRVPLISDAEAAFIEQAVITEDIRITALSPGIFKHPLSDAAAIERDLDDLLPRTIAMAKRFGAPLIIAFGFRRLPQDDESLHRCALGYFRRAAALAEQSGIVIAIENEPDTWCDTGTATAAFLKEINSVHLRANWDPANAVGTYEVPFPNGYKALKPYIVNVHVKDTIEGALVKCVPVGQGIVAWKAQVRALLEDNIISHITVETHCLPLIEQSDYNVRTLRAYMNDLNVLS